MRAPLASRTRSLKISMRGGRDMQKKYDRLSAQVAIKGILKARTVLKHYINRTNLIYYSELSRLIGMRGLRQA